MLCYYNNNNNIMNGTLWTLRYRSAAAAVILFQDNRRVCQRHCFYHAVSYLNIIARGHPNLDANVVPCEFSVFFCLLNTTSISLLLLCAVPRISAITIFRRQTDGRTYRFTIVPKSTAVCRALLSGVITNTV